ncbi:hypothetical protein C5C39_02290 [Rathayibacter sp. AY1F3]|uniref:Gfo/Idh/MocA family protein n=1 Tax=Rathayibacter sp. AY1F3 TaxID=2080558 RepID=UPI000CE8E0C6|nr:Gfo/Idh/MocA family oxidoreductase [Rathayibacter sp. AY1F3]PPG92860.1 hypothetical protein C5C39_02290 [Rathayibacter sp. AY1F3]
MSAPPIPVIIGSGLIAQSHAAALRSLGIHDLVVWSPRESSRRRFADQWGATIASTLEEALDYTGATHAHVCSTPMQHLEPIERAAARGLTILSEKPLAPTLQLARRAADAVERGGAAGWVGFNRRLDGGIQLMRKVIGEGEIGRPVSVFGHYRQQWNAEPSGNDWRYDPAAVGPSRTVTEIGSHWFDLVAFVLGTPPTTVNAQFGFLGERSWTGPEGSGRVAPPNEDLFAALLRFDDGVTGAVYGTELSHGSFDEIELRIDGSLGSAFWDAAHPNLVRVGNKTSGIRTLGMDAPSTALADTIAAVYSGRAAEAGVASFSDGVANAAVLDAVTTSAASNAWEATQS